METLKLVEAVTLIAVPCTPVAAASVDVDSRRLAPALDPEGEWRRGRSGFQAWAWPAHGLGEGSAAL